MAADAPAGTTFDRSTSRARPAPRGAPDRVSAARAGEMATKPLADATLAALVAAAVAGAPLTSLRHRPVPATAGARPPSTASTLVFRNVARASAPAPVRCSPSPPNQSPCPVL